MKKDPFVTTNYVVLLNGQPLASRCTKEAAQHELVRLRKLAQSAVAAGRWTVQPVDHEDS